MASLSGSMEPHGPGIAPQGAYLAGDTDVYFRRWLAHMMDGVFLGVVIVPFLVLAAMISAPLIVAVLVLWPTLGRVSYFVLTQRRSGQSPGKRLAGVRVINRAGEPPDMRALIKRSLPLVFEVTDVIALLSMGRSPDVQRLGDRWAGTYVVNAR